MTTVSSAGSLRRLIASGSLRTVYQPIVDLDTHAPVAYEALVRGPQGSPLESPAALFGQAGAAGLVVELDRAARAAAIDGALAAGLRPPHTLFLNVEPSTLDGSGSLLGSEVGRVANRRRVHRARAGRAACRGARRHRLAARARLRHRARRRRHRRALARADAVCRARRDQARHVADPGAPPVAHDGARPQRRRRRGRALGRSAARRGRGDRGAPRARTRSAPRSPRAGTSAGPASCRLRPPSPPAPPSRCGAAPSRPRASRRSS